MERSKLDTLFLAYRTSGDATALAQVFDLAAPELYELARRLSPDRSVAEDVLQDTFVAAIEKRSSWDEREPLLPWLIGILAIASQRRRRERARTVDPERLAQTQVERPDEALEASERHGQLLAALAALKPEERSLVEQRLLEGCSPSDMARELGMSSSTLRMRLSRAIARLRRAAPAGLSWALLPSWPSQKALASVRLRLLPNVPAAAPLHTSINLAAGVLGALTLAGAAAIVACLGPEKPVQPPAQTKAEAPAAEAIPEPKLVTIGLPPREGEFVAPPVPPDAPRKRLQLLVNREGHPLAHAEVLRLFPDAGFEGVGHTDARGRIDIDVVLQPSVTLRIRGQGCKSANFRVEPHRLKDVEERTLALEPGPEPAYVTFHFAWAFPPGFFARFVPIDLLKGQRPNFRELYQKFPKAVHDPECGLSGVDAKGFLSNPIAPGHYWVLAQREDTACRESPDLLPCCFELTIPEGQFFDCEYPGAVGGSIVLDVVGPATIGADVAVSIDDGVEAPRQLWFQTYCDSGGSTNSTNINVGTLHARSEAIPAGEHELVFTQRGKEIERRTVTIVRGEELKLSISP